jgi:hypothetical protein
LLQFNQKGSVFLKNIGATRVVASTLGALVGLAGIEHGFFEILQGNVKPDGLLVDAIGSAQRFWEYSSEPALTIVPNMLLSGILAIIIGIVVTIWATYYVDRKYGARVLMLLSIILWLVGGGFAPVFMAIFAFIAASRIDRPLKWWCLALRSQYSATLCCGSLVQKLLTAFNGL